MSLAPTPSARGWRARSTGVLLWAAVPFAAALYQVAAKLCADALGAPGAGDALGAVGRHLPLVLAVVGCDLACFVAWLLVLERTSLSAAFPLSAASYVLVIAAGALVFHEPLKPFELAGAALILGGVGLVAPREPA